MSAAVDIFDEAPAADAELAEYADKLIAQGAWLFPLRAGTKRPAHIGWQAEASRNPETVRAWIASGYDLGILTEKLGDDAALLVIDVDVRDGAKPKDGRAILKALQAEGKEFPDTLVHESPTSAGGHMFYRVPTAVKSDTKGKSFGPGVDVKSRGGLVACIRDGKVYRSNGLLIADAPPWMIDRCGVAPERQPIKTDPADLEKLNALQERQIARAIGDLKASPVAPEGTRNNATHQRACHLKNLGVLDYRKATSLIAENGRCESDLDYDEIERTTRSAYDDETVPLGDLVPELIFEQIVGDDGQPVKPVTETPADAVQPAPVPFSEVLARAVPPVQELVPDLIEKGTVTFLSAPGGSHKSRLAVQWGLSLDVGAQIFGREVKRAAFVYVSYEDHADEVARRAQTIARRLNLPTESTGQFWDLSGKDSPLAIVQESGACELQPFWHRLRGHLQATPGHKFVVLDSTYNALRFAGKAKVNETSVMVAIGLLQRLADETDSTILVLWHPSQAGQERGDASGWSVAWHNAPRARLSLTAVKDTEDAFELRVEKRNHGPKGKPLMLYWSDGVLLPRSAIDTAEQTTRLIDACVSVAIVAAEQGAPVQRQRRVEKWALDRIESAVGYRPPDREVKEALARGLSIGRLRYVGATRHRVAGFYPADAQRAAELAGSAKRYCGKPSTAKV